MSIGKAAEVLDNVYPGWASEIDVTTFNIHDPDRCILAQLFGEYFSGLTILKGRGVDHSVLSAFSYDNIRWMNQIYIRTQHRRIEQKIREVAIILDDKKPGWADEIDTDALAMMEPKQCIVGQLFGDYYDGKMYLGLESTYFAAPLTGGEKAWIKEIADRTTVEKNGVFKRLLSMLKKGA